MTGQKEYLIIFPLRDVISKLNKRDQTIIYMRYYLDCTQSDIAERIGISQVQVSRLEKKILAQLKSWMGVNAGGKYCKK